MMKTMSTSDLWNSMEKEGPDARSLGNGWVLHRALPTVECHVFVAIEGGSGRRAILLQLASETDVGRSRRPRIRGLELVVVSIEGMAYFGVILKEPRYVDVFAALCEDLIRRVAELGDPPSRLTAFVGQLIRWQKFLAASMDGLGEEAQRGLWGELYFLRQYLCPLLGPASVLGWKGAEKAHQDFQFPQAGIEIKTTLAKRPQVVRITSERQLDTATCPVLFLHVLSLEAREGAGESLPALVMSLRKLLAADSAMLECLEDGLLKAGYLEIHVPQYFSRGYVIRAQDTFAVRKQFPRIEEKDIPTGIGDVSYGLSVAACARFETGVDAVGKVLLGKMPGIAKKARNNHG